MLRPQGDYGGERGTLSETPLWAQTRLTPASKPRPRGSAGDATVWGARDVEMIAQLGSRRRIEGEVLAGWPECTRADQGSGTL